MKVKDTALAAVQIKAGPEDGLGDGQFSAYASVFGNKDSYGDVVQPGAFEKDLAAWKASGQNIPLLFGHQMSDPDFNIGHVVEASEDEKGLLVTAQLDLENPKAVQVYRMLKGRRVNQMSFAYDVIDGGHETVDGEEFYALRELKVYEVSVVTIGANQETEVLAVKSAAASLCSKAGRVISAKNEKALRNAHDQLVGAADEIKNVLAAIDGSEADDQGKASDEPAVKSGASDEEPSGVKSSVPVEEPEAKSSVERLAAQIRIDALKWAQEGA